MTSTETITSSETTTAPSLPGAAPSVASGVPVLQPLGDRPVAPSDGPGYLPATPGTVLWGRLPCASDSPVLSVDPGQEVWVDTVSHEGILEDQGRDPVAFFTGHGVLGENVLHDAVQVAREVPHDPAVDGPHVVTGPIEVRGALPGDVLSVTVVDLRLRAGYGVVSSRHGRGALPGELPDPRSPGPVSILCTVEDGPDGLSGSLPVGPGDTRRVRFPLAPFLGTTGVAVAGGTRPHSVPPGQHGGNLDVSVLGAGSTLHLPVQVPGALAYVGDPHFSQGDGEVALTAFEAPLRALLRFDLVRQGDAHGTDDAPASTPAPATSPGPTGPWAETDELLVAIGLDADLGEAMRDATRCALALLEREGMHPAHAYAYLSAAGDFAVSQVVDQVCGVHGAIRKADLRELRGPSAPPQA